MAQLLKGQLFFLTFNFPLENGFLLKIICYWAKIIEGTEITLSLTGKEDMNFSNCKNKQSFRNGGSSILLKQKCKCILMSFFRGYGRNVISPYEGQECRRKSRTIKNWGLRYFSSFVGTPGNSGKQSKQSLP